MAKVLLAMNGDHRKGKSKGRGKGKKAEPNASGGSRPPLGRNQCAYCKEEGHWKKDCLKRPRAGARAGPIPVLVEEVD